MPRGYNDNRREWDFPSLRETITLASGQDRADTEDCKFYPYTKPGIDPICAVVNYTHILILRMPVKKSEKVEIIQTIHDDDLDAGNNSLCWSKTQDGQPLLCFTGRNTKIKIIDPITGKLLQTLVGHGGGVNDVAVSPVNPEILATAADDTTIRLWSLNQAHKDKPCTAILAGGGHKANVLSIAFHGSGRYLLSSGDDQVVNMWTLPGFPNKDTGTDHPTLIHYPHFSSSEVHSNIVDCVAFHGDLILSKAWAENCIVLWSINGFDSSKPPPNPTDAPTNHDSQHDTRSSFSTDAPQYTRLLEFALPGCREIYMRFSVYNSLDTATDHPVLAACNSESTIMFWDFTRLTAYHEFVTDVSAIPGSSVAKPSWLTAKTGPRKNQPADPTKRIKEGSPTESNLSHHTASTETVTSDSADFSTNRMVWDAKYALGTGILIQKDGEDVMVQPHKKVSIPKLSAHVTGRQVAWSVGGEWCVAVWSPNVISVFQRWEGLGTSA